MRRYYVAEKGKNTGGKRSKKMAALNASTSDFYRFFGMSFSATTEILSDE